MAGRPRIPPEIHKSKGTYRSDRHPDNPIKPMYITSLDDCPPPAHLMESAKEYYRTLTQDLLDMKVLSHELLGTVECVAIQAGLRDELMESLPLLDKGTKEYIDVASKIFTANKSVFDMRRQLSMTPSTRANISVEKDKSKEDNVSQFLPGDLVS